MILICNYFQMKSRCGKKVRVHLSAELGGLEILHNLLILLHWGQINQAGQLLAKTLLIQSLHISLVTFLRIPKSVKSQLTRGFST